MGEKDARDAHLKYEVKKVFAGARDVCVLYDLTPDGVKVFAAEWYQVKDGQSSSFRVVFDPRPMLAGKAA